MRLKFLHLHLHGLIRSKNLELGRDADTGGQTQYVLELIKSTKKYNNGFSYFRTFLRYLAV